MKTNINNTLPLVFILIMSWYFPLFQTQAAPPPSTNEATEITDVRLGGVAQWIIEYGNPGNVPLYNVTVTDPTEPSCSRTFEVLQPGDRDFFYCISKNLQHTTVNQAIITGDYEKMEGGTGTLKASDKAVAMVPDTNPSDLIVSKTGIADTNRDGVYSGGSGDSLTEMSPGDTAEYHFSYQSSGTLVQSGVVIQDKIPVGTCADKTSFESISGAVLEFSTDHGVSWSGDNTNMASCSITDFRYRFLSPMGGSAGANVADLPYVFTGSMPDYDYTGGTMYSESGVSLMQSTHITGINTVCPDGCYSQRVLLTLHNDNSITKDNSTIPEGYITKYSLMGYPLEIIGVYNGNLGYYTRDNNRNYVFTDVGPIQYSWLNDSTPIYDSEKKNIIGLIYHYETWNNDKAWIMRKNSAGDWVVDVLYDSPTTRVAYGITDTVILGQTNGEINKILVSLESAWTNIVNLRYFAYENGAWAYMSGATNSDQVSFNNHIDTKRVGDTLQEFITTGDTIYGFDGANISQTGLVSLAGSGNYSGDMDFLGLTYDNLGNLNELLAYRGQTTNPLISWDGNQWNTGSFMGFSGSFAHLIPITYVGKSIVDFIAISGSGGRPYLNEYQNMGGSWTENPIDISGFTGSTYSYGSEGISHVLVQDADGSINTIVLHIGGYNVLILKKVGGVWMMDSSQNLGETNLGAGGISGVLGNIVLSGAYEEKGYRTLIFPPSTDAYRSIQVSESQYSGSTITYNVGFMGTGTVCETDQWGDQICSIKYGPQFSLFDLVADSSGHVDISDLVVPPGESTYVVRVHLATDDLTRTPYMHTIKLTDGSRLQGLPGGSFKYRVNLPADYTGDKIDNTVTGLSVSADLDLSNNISTHSFKVLHPVVETLAHIFAQRDVSYITNNQTGSINILGNDTFSGATPTPSVVSVTLSGSSSSIIPGAFIDPSGILMVPPTSLSGTYTVWYTICDKSHVDNCSSAPVEVHLAAPPTVVPPVVVPSTPAPSGGGGGTSSTPPTPISVPVQVSTLSGMTDLSSAPITPVLPSKVFPAFVPSCRSAVTNLDDPRLVAYYDELGVVDKGDMYGSRRLSRVEFLKLVLNAAKVDLSKAPVIKTYRDIGDGKINGSGTGASSLEVWYKKYVDYATAAGIVSGDKYSNFRPNDIITRAEASKIFVQALGVEPAKLATTFADVARDNSLGGYIEAAYDSCLVHGRNTHDGVPVDGGPRRFEPSDSISLGETAKVLYNSTHQSGE